MKQIKRKLNYVILLIAMLVAVPAFAQEYFDPFGSLSVGLKVSPTLGYGIEAATPINDHFIVRLGLTLTSGIKTDYMNFVIPDDNNEMVESFGYVPDYRAKLGMNFTHGNLLLDYHPAGIFHITAGVYVGESRFKVNGFLADWRNGNKPAELRVDPNNPNKYYWPKVELGDQTVDLEGGVANIDLKLGTLPVKPYVGLGLGRAIAKDSRVSFKFEIGAFYQGDYVLSQDGKKLDLSESTNQDVKDAHDIISKFNIWPVMNFQLSYRIF